MERGIEFSIYEDHTQPQLTIAYSLAAEGCSYESVLFIYSCVVSCCACALCGLWMGLSPFFAPRATGGNAVPVADNTVSYGTGIIVYDRFR